MEQLGGLDAAFLYCETPGMHMHVCGLLVLDPATMKGDPYDAVHAMMLGALTKVPLMRKRLASVPLGISRPFWVDDVDFDVVRHLHRAQVDPPGDERALARMVGDVASRPLRRDRPLWEAWFIEGLARGNVALLVKMHHATIDGVSGVSIMGRLFDFDAPHPGSSRPADSWQPQPVPGSLALLGRGVLARFAAPLEVARLVPVTVGRVGTTLWNLGTRRDNGHGSVRPFTAPRTSFNATLTARRSTAFTDVPLADFKRVKKAFDVKINDVLAAVMGGALRRYLADRGELPLRPLNAAEPVSVHGRTGGVKGVTKLSVIFSTLATDVEDPAQRLRTVAAANLRAKQTSATMGADTFTRWSEQVWPNALSWGARLYSGLRMAEHHGVVFNLLLSNVAGPPFALYLAGGHVVGTYAFGPVTDGAGLNVTVISTDDRVGFGITACSDLVPQVWDLADAIAPALDELTAAARRLRAPTGSRARRPRSP
ncbi:MAG TPA: wax ester/triacylglycerol synthase family O-acyltransferase [Acidimicrobiales bacterium]|nr:wax ester/triacylglycerol synthase family O-acyltransferase [Acidimicrobiales bacterium]